uniref:uncharacterized protein LOC120824653 n=1 Tax=Gasterosteus aculeatus aculeatus TaxID=481459 RepID=UPI001A99B634|nr:uncharacterized protein LOC120824653 [Gasterosteus aculeatus aculeatus]
MQVARSFVRRMSSALPRHVVWQSEGLVAYLHPRPWTPGVVVLEGGAPGGLGVGVFQLEEPVFLSWLLGARAVAGLLCERLGVHRCALVSRPHRDRPAQILVLPLHGLDAGWAPPPVGRRGTQATNDPGYCTSKNAPRWSDASLTRTQTKIRLSEALGRPHLAWGLT